MRVLTATPDLHNTRTTDEVLDSLRWPESCGIEGSFSAALHVLLPRSGGRGMREAEGLLTSSGMSCF